VKYGSNIGFMGSCGMICMPGFLNSGSAIQMLVGGNTYSYREYSDSINTLTFFQNK
jgi:hypothetical protein